MEAPELGMWFERCAGALVLYARQWVDRAAAEDVVQEVFLRLMERGVRTSGDAADCSGAEEAAAGIENVRAWLFASVRHELIDEHRSSERRARREQSAGTQKHASLAAPDVGAALNAAEVEAVLRVLAPEQREIVVMRVWGGLTFQEVATLLRMPLSTAHSQYAGALRTMRETLERNAKPKHVGVRPR